MISGYKVTQFYSILHSAQEYLPESNHSIQNLFRFPSSLGCHPRRNTYLASLHNKILQKEP